MSSIFIIIRGLLFTTNAEILAWAGITELDDIKEFCKSERCLL